MTKNSRYILVVDDEPLVRESLEAYLEDEGFSVVGACSGEVALECIAKAAPGVVIVDMRLPGISGNEVILRGSALCPGLPFLVHTGAPSYVVPPDLGRIGLRAEDIFHKPVLNLNFMVQRIKEHLA